jgi:outer membrane protein assembly factor BamD (BamD/ComL family)
MSTTPTHTPSTSKTTSEQSEVKLEQHLLWLAPLTAVILVVASLFMWKQSRNTQFRDEVLNAYTQASTADELAALSEVYPDQPEAPLALLQAAALQYNESEFEAAKSFYARFEALYPAHPLLNNATWGKWMSGEALGELDEALEGFQSISSEQILYPQAVLGQARIHEKQSHPDEAFELYTLILEEFPDSAWAEQARVFSDQLKRQLRRETEEL